LSIVLNKKIRILFASNIYIIDADGKNEKVLLRDASYGSVILK
jgi:hypothetical protein